MIDAKKKAFVIQLLRRGTYRWYGRWQAEKRSKLERNTYFCENPDCGIIGGKKDFQMDHHETIVDPVKGWQGFDSYIDRIFCEPELYRRLCKACHETKTKVENELRKATRLKKKLDKPE